jgi:anti-sigma-K factor RskA
MRPVQPEELSALLDRELSPKRADEVRAQVSVDSAMAEELKTLAHFDTRWRALATASAFEPRVDLPRRSQFWRSALLATGAVALIVIRLAPKFLDSAVLGVTLNVLALAVVLGAVFWLTRNVLYSMIDSR